MAVTSTAKGIAPKFLLLGTAAGQVKSRHCWRLLCLSLHLVAWQTSVYELMCPACRAQQRQHKHDVVACDCPASSCLLRNPANQERTGSGTKHEYVQC